MKRSSVIFALASFILLLPSCSAPKEYSSSSTNSDSATSGTSFSTAPEPESSISVGTDDALKASKELFPGHVYMSTTSGVYSYDTVNTSYASIVGYVGANTEANEIVTIPSTLDSKTVISIGDYAFVYANALTNNSNRVSVKKITIPSSVTSIGSYAFKSLNDLTEIVIPDDSAITSFAEGTFSFCYALGNLYIPRGITRIPDYCFYHCESLGETTRSTYYYDTTSSTMVTTLDVEIPAAQRGIYGKLSGASEYTSSLPAISEIREGAFAFNFSLKSFTCPTYLDFIDNQAFSNCKVLKTFNFNTYIRKIGDYCFQNDAGFVETDANCDFSHATKCPYLDDVGIQIFKDCVETVTTEYSSSSFSSTSTTTTYPSFISNDGTFLYAYDWVVGIYNYTTFSATSTFSFTDGTIGISRDLLRLIPNNHQSSAIKITSTSNKPVQVTLPDSLIYASNNFIRQSGDDFAVSGIASRQNNVDGFDAIAFTSFKRTDYTAVTIPSANTHFQIIDVSANGTVSGADSTQTYQHLVNYYLGYTPTSGAVGTVGTPEARLIASTRYAYWDAKNSFADLSDSNVVSGNSTLFSNQTGYTALTNYTILSAQSGMGTINYFNHNHMGDSSPLINFTGTANGSSYSCTIPHTGSASINTSSAYIQNTSFFGTYTTGTSIDVTVTASLDSGTGTSYGSLKVYGMNGSTATQYATLTLSSPSSTEYSGTISLTTKNISGLKILLTKGNYNCIITKVEATLHYTTTTSSSSSSSTTDNTTSASATDLTTWSFSSTTNVTKPTTTNNVIFFPSTCKRVEDRILEGFINYVYMFFLPSSLDYVGRELVGGSITYKAISQYHYFILQDASFNVHWNELFGITSRLSGNKVSEMTACARFVFGTTLTIDGNNGWGS